MHSHRNHRTTSHSSTAASYHRNGNSRGSTAANVNNYTTAARAAGPAPDTEPPTRPLTCVAESTTLAFACYDELTNQILLEECPAHGGADTERAGDLWN